MMVGRDAPALACWAVFPPDGDIAAALFVDDRPELFPGADLALDQAKRWRSRTYGAGRGRLVHLSIVITEVTAP